MEVDDVFGDDDEAPPQYRASPDLESGMEQLVRFFDKNLLRFIINK